MKEYKFKVDGQDYTSSVEEVESGKLTVTVNGKAYTVEVPEQKSVLPKVIHHVVHHVGAGAAPVAKAKKVPEKVVSPMPGTVIKINVKNGQKVKTGEVLLVIETMKMANDIVAEANGIVKAVLVNLGQNVMQGDILVDFEGAPDVIEEALTHASPVAAGGSKTVVAPLPGTVKKVLVKPGQTVKRGETVLTMEAMKMENNIAAESDGKVKAVHVNPDAQVNQGDLLIELE